MSAPDPDDAPLTAEEQAAVERQGDLIAWERRVERPRSRPESAPPAAASPPLPRRRPRGAVPAPRAETAAAECPPHDWGPDDVCRKCREFNWRW